MANSITIVSGSMQGAFISTVFASPVVVLVRNAGVPQSGVTVTSIVPGSGASATTSATLVTNSSGNASFTLTANGTNGQYTVGFSVAGGNIAAVLLKNSTPVSTSQTKTPALQTQQTYSYGGNPGTVAWSNLGNIIATGTSLYAQVVPTGSANSQLLKGSTFGFTLPAGAVHLGTEFFFKGITSTSGVTGGGAAFLYSGTINDSGAQYIDPSIAWRTSITIGGSSNLWGATPFTADQINDNSFTVAIIMYASISTTYRTNEWSLKIYYATAPSLPVADTVSPLVFCAN